MKKILAAFLFVASILAAQASHAATLTINVPSVEVEVPPGGTQSGEITVENPTETEASLKTYLEDWMYVTPDGDKKFAPPGSMPISASDWLTFASPGTSIPPYGRVTVRYTLRVPEDAKGGHYSVMFFETIVGNQVDQEGVSVDVAGRIGTLFVVLPKGTVVRSGEIASLDIEAPEGNRPMKIKTVFKNTGNVHISLEGTFLILDEAGQIRARGELLKLYTFPGQSGERVSEWVGRLPKGNYTAIVTYNLGKGKSLVEERALTIA